MRPEQLVAVWAAQTINDILQANAKEGETILEWTPENVLLMSGVGTDEQRVEKLTHEIETARGRIFDQFLADFNATPEDALLFTKTELRGEEFLADFVSIVPQSILKDTVSSEIAATYPTIRLGFTYENKNRPDASVGDPDSGGGDDEPCPGAVGPYCP